MGAVLALAVAPTSANGASTKTLMQLRMEGKPLNAGAEVLLVAGYSLGECYWEEQEFKVVANGAKTDKLVRLNQSGLVEGCDGGAKVIEITSARKMTVKMAPMRIHLTGPCVYEFKEISTTFRQREWGPEIEGTATGKLYAAESPHSAACAKTRNTVFDMALSGVETELIA
ncbi:MAG TPA: hypothetical protein VKG38_12285 [Solirubrobacteraceae bacterium]|nr:hypothetical protein [Solirubrobacteraceae bacterium]